MTPVAKYKRQPCPLCGAKTASEAVRICAPKIHCPASDLVDDDGFIAVLTNESAREMDKWFEREFEK